MSTLNQLAIDADVDKGNADSLGGYTKPTGLYPCTIDMAYMAKSKGGAWGLNLHLKSAADKSIIRQTLWVTSGDAKGNKNFYINQSGKKFLLPGMQLADQISRIAADHSMAECTIEKKTIKLWDRDAQAEKPTEVDVVTDLLGQPILIGLHLCRTNKAVKDGNGKYVPTPEERKFNEIDKVFHPDGFSVTEKDANAKKAKFHKQWSDKYGEDFVDDTFDPNVKSTEDDSLPDEDTGGTGGFDFS